MLPDIGIRPKIEGELHRLPFAAGNHPQFQLALLAERVGWLGPGPAGFALWIIPAFGVLEQFAEDLIERDGSLIVDLAGVYVDVGKEIL